MDEGQTQRDKLRTAQALLKAARKNVVMIQDHRLDEQMLAQFRTRYPMFQIAGSAAVRTEKKVLMLGASVIWNRYRYGEPYEQRDIVRGRVGYVTFNRRNHYTSFMSIYIKPDEAGMGMRNGSETRKYLINNWRWLRTSKKQ